MILDIFKKLVKPDRNYCSIKGKRSMMNLNCVSGTITCSGATSTVAGLLPAGAIILSVTARVTKTITGATTWTLGDGVTADRYGASIGLTLGTTLTSANWKTSAAAAQDYMPHFVESARTMTATATGSNFTAGTIYVEVIYYTASGPVA